MDALQNLRVLVVENDEMTGTLLQLQLGQQGAQVIGPAPSVQSALDLLAAHDPQVALLDYRLANDETCEPVVQALADRGIPYVLATGMDIARLPDSFRLAVLLRKPYLAAELAKALEKALEQAETSPAAG